MARAAIESARQFVERLTVLTAQVRPDASDERTRDTMAGVEQQLEQNESAPLSKPQEQGRTGKERSR
jgi:hypothetical protein